MRIVSLLPSATDALVALGAADAIVGVSHSCDAAVPGAAVVTSCAIDDAAPPGAIDAAVRATVGEGRALYELDAARIAGLAPDLIFTQGLCEVCAVSEAAVHRLAASLPAPPRVVSLSGGTIDGVIADLCRVADAIGRPDAGEALAATLRSRMRQVHETLKAARAPRPRAAVLEWTDPVFAGGHWVPEQVRRAGGIDVLAAAGEHSRVVRWDEVRAAAPEIVFVAPCGFGVDRSVAEARAAIASQPWLASAQVWALDANALTSRPGPGVVDGIEVMAAVIAPALFRAPAPHVARRVAPD